MAHGLTLNGLTLKKIIVTVICYYKMLTRQNLFFCYRSNHSATTAGSIFKIKDAMKILRKLELSKPIFTKMTSRCLLILFYLWTSKGALVHLFGTNMIYSHNMTEYFGYISFFWFIGHDISSNTPYPKNPQKTTILTWQISAQIWTTDAQIL